MSVSINGTGMVVGPVNISVTGQTLGQALMHTNSYDKTKFLSDFLRYSHFNEAHTIAINHDMPLHGYSFGCVNLVNSMLNDIIYHSSTVAPNIDDLILNNGIRINDIDHLTTVRAILNNYVNSIDNIVTELNQQQFEDNIEKLGNSLNASST